MKAVGFNKFGAADVLESLDIPLPILKDDSVLICVTAAGVNPADWRLRNGQFKGFIKTPFPFIPGSDIAGIVEQVGAAVRRFHPGDKVYTMLPTATAGGYAQYAVAAEKTVALTPSNLSLEQSAAIPLTAMTALQALRDKANLQRGASVLIYGASGGVGTFAIQIAKAMGAHVTAICSGPNADFVRELGADAVIDYNTQNFMAVSTRYDVIFDAVNYLPFWKGLNLLNPKGILVSVNPILAIIPTYKWLAQLRGKRLASIFVEPKGADLEALNQWIESGNLRPVIEQFYSIAQVVEAHHRSETGRVRGKLVLIVDQSVVAQQPTA